MRDIPPRDLQDATHCTLLILIKRYQGIYIPSTERDHWEFKKNMLRWVMQLSAGRASPSKAEAFIDQHLKPGALDQERVNYLTAMLSQRIEDFEQGT